MTDSSLQSLLEDEATAEALAIVLARAEEGNGTVTWQSVSGAVPAEVWGQIVGSELLVSVGDSFVIDDPPALREALNTAGIDVTADISIEETEALPGWRLTDKVAGAGALVLATGYQIPAIKSSVVSGANIMFGPLAGAVPFWMLVTLLAVTVAAISTGVRRRLVDQQQVTSIKERLKTTKEQLREAEERGDETAVERLRERRDELMRSQLGILTHMLRPLAWTMLVTVPVFLWVSWAVVAPQFAIGATTPALPVLGRMAWTARVLGPVPLWMVYYTLNVVVSNLVIKRATKRVTDNQAAA
ncbi:DUF106 domain-containing protein [Halovenus salina]|uniref:DUF106 domain-containing protein n=1 Tax=Halovenus salina TaxID=1510225 RepID=A0ABD5W5S4_9EURY|nr:EMC3/TMCO1 family protein [Halovenus salina]